MTLALQFLGAARHVTGSKHLLQVGRRRVLLDCGLVQGPRKVADAANRHLPVAGRDVDAVVLSHAHIDHCGSLPRLVRDGFDRAIHCTEATGSMLRLMLMDAAKIQAQDAEYLRRKGHQIEPLYDEKDVERTLRLVRSVPYRRRTEVLPGVAVEFLDAGHILGAAIVVLDVEHERQQRRVVFTGDHGRKNLPILRDPEPIPACDVLITESTYGDRLHADPVDMEAELERVVREEQRAGGRILIPAFSVGRTQAVVLFLGRLMERGRIPRLPVYVDSPMSREATRIMAGYPDLYDDETRAMLRRGEHPFYFAGVRYVADVEESKSLNGVREAIIVSASGMCESGRILHHLKHSVEHPQDCLLLVAFQAQGTLGRRLLDGERRARILGVEYDVRCRVRFVPGLSAHADYRELLGFTEHLSRTCQQTFVVHGESPSAESFADKLRAHGFARVEVPSQGDRFELV